MKRGMPSGAQTPDGIIFLLALIFSKAPPRYPPHHGAHWAYTPIPPLPWGSLGAYVVATVQELQHCATLIDIFLKNSGRRLEQRSSIFCDKRNCFEKDVKLNKRCTTI